MRKKFIGVYALMAVLALGTTVTSCVDDNESASVTAIRDAKAKQLAALAAESEAQAEVNKALAALKQAKADAVNAKTEFEKQEYAMRLEKLRAEYDKAIAEAKKAQQEAENQMQNNLITQQGKLWNAYTNARNKALKISTDIANTNIEIAQLEAGLASAEAVLASSKYDKEVELKGWEARLAALEGLAENNIDELRKQFEDAKVAKEVADKEVTGKTSAFTNAQKALNTAVINKIDGGTVNGGTVKSPLKVKAAIAYLTSQEAKALVDNIDVTKNGDVVKATEEDLFNSLSSTDLVALNGKLEYQLITLNEVNVDLANDALDNAKETLTNKLGKKDDKATSYQPFTDDQLGNFTQDDLTNAWISTTAYAMYNYYVEAVKTAEKALEGQKAIITTNELEITKKEGQIAELDPDTNKEQIENLKAEIKALQEANKKIEEAIKNTYTPAVNAAKKSEGYANVILTTANEIIEESDEKVQEYKDNLAIMAADSEDYKAYVAAVKGVMETEGKAVVEADKALNTAKVAQAEKQAAFDVVNGAISGTLDIEKAKLECGKKIAEIKEEIAGLDDAIYTISTNPEEVSAIEIAINYKKAQIEYYEEELALAEQQAELYKNQFEASLKAE